MKKVILTMIAACAILFASFLFYARWQVVANRQIISQQVKQEGQLVKAPTFTTSYVIGDSMEPFGYKDGDTFTKKESDTCEIGDICTFTCISTKCQDHQNELMFKRVVKKMDNEKYWLEGRPGKYDVTTNKTKNKNGTITETTNWKFSFDSNIFGWMENGKDIDIDGIIVKNDTQNEN